MLSKYHKKEKKIFPHFEALNFKNEKIEISLLKSIGGKYKVGWRPSTSAGEFHWVKLSVRKNFWTGAKIASREFFLLKNTSDHPNIVLTLKPN
jgi:hypothetical protein